MVGSMEDGGLSLDTMSVSYEWNETLGWDRAVFLEAVLA